MNKIEIVIHHVYDEEDAEEYWTVSDNGGDWDDETIDDLNDIEHVVDERSGYDEANGLEVNIVHHSVRW